MKSTAGEELKLMKNNGSIPGNELVFGIGTALVALTLILLIIPSGVETAADDAALPLSPAFLPYLTAVLIFLVGVLHAIEAIKSGTRSTGTTGLSGIQFHPRWILRLVILSVCFVGYLYLSGLLGIPLTAIVITACLMLMGGERSPVILIAGSVILPILVFLFFTRIAQVPLPMGIFE